MRLTQKSVDDMPLRPDSVTWDESPGLGLRVQAGKRSWIVRYRVAGVSRQKTLPGDLSLKLARQKAAEIRAGAAVGEDIVETGRRAAAEAHREAQTAKAKFLGALVEPYLGVAATRLRPASLRVAQMYLRGQWRALHD